MTDAPPWTFGRLLTWTAEHFSAAGIDSARLDAEVLLAHARRCKRIELYTVYDETPPTALRESFKTLVKRRCAGEPVAYLVGAKEFYSLSFEVTPDVLIPRPETETLVVALTDRARACDPGERRRKIADVGAGSGVLAVCAAKYIADADVLATDTSAAALRVAQRNAERHGVADRTFFVQADLFPASKPAMGLDFILSNPPYVTTAELAGLDPTVRDREPRAALDGGPEGTSVIERLLPAAARQLRPGGVLLVEISPMIATRVERLVHETGGLELRPTIKDAAGRTRVIEAVRRTTDHPTAGAPA